jgi:glutathione S-transferase
MTAIEAPILYSFRRCPYAIRTRLALAFARQQVELREVVLKDKPQEMLAISPKATVPVLQLPDGSVIEESRDIMLWALHLNDPDALLVGEPSEATAVLLDENDGEFKHWLDRYKYADRYPERNAQEYRSEGCEFLNKLEQRLEHSAFLCGEQMRIADIAIMPFVRQFAMVDQAWFDSAPYPALQAWLRGLVDGEIFMRMMKKHAPWQQEQARVLLLD